MRKVWNLQYVLILASILVIGMPDVQAQTKLTPIQILAKMDKTISGYKDQVMKNTMTITNEKGEKRSYDFTVMQKGTKKRLVRFTSGEIKGMALLVLGKSKAFVYLPGFKKVRRVAAHAMTQSFAGSDFTNEDSTPRAWSEMCIPSLLKEDKDHWYINCKLKPDAGLHYSRLVMMVGKKTFFEDGVDYYGPDGKLIKKMRSSHPKDFHGVKINSVVVMTDVRTGHSTRLDIHDFKVNQGLPDSMFTVRQLKWGM